MAIVIFMAFIHFISSLIAAVVAPLLEIFSISGLIGFYIVYYGSSLLTSVLSVIGDAYSVLNILFGDFLVFLHDIALLIGFSLYFCVEFVGFVVEIIIDFLVYVRDLIVDICVLPVILCHWVVSVCENLLSLAANAAEQFKGALTLLGSGIWVALLFVPYSLLFTAEFLTCLCVKLVNNFYLGVISMTDRIVRGLYDTAFKLIHFFVDIPITAFAGLVVGALLLWLVYEKQHAFNHLLIRVYRFNLKILNCFILLVKIPCQQLLRQIEVYGLNYWFRRSRAYQTRGAALGVNTSNPTATSSCHDIDSKDFSKLKKRLEKELEEKLCSVCQERRKTVIVLPCRHLCMCEECVLIVERLSRKCPLCRRHIVKTMAVYL